MPIASSSGTPPCIGIPDRHCSILVPCMKTPATAHILALVATAARRVVYGDSIDHAHLTTSDVIELPFELDHVGGLPTHDQLIVLSKWSLAELNSFADFFLLSPRSPRHKKQSFSFHRASGNFAECHVVLDATQDAAPTPYDHARHTKMP
ncbi:hypothetical protein H310_02651 [Aphanomyces invadans]|uniref:Uncharacterized protein n=1 Tax=Aphanomyces invadans TaxID=157072 RepID=A0A024UJM8_9STRA|nr:hypothetical protein H310_02651 [Aphanomyces invadans]ETW06375.1 hypothetical protein H310_02651 [Aphanomyces invadans]|eukprot:XP_008864450.1 hypothetical protein H310_02651 [Aphanomyces invadans]